VGYLIHQSKLRLQNKLLHVHVAGDTVHILCTDQEAADETGAFIAQRIKHITSPQMKVKLYLTDIGLASRSQLMTMLGNFGDVLRIAMFSSNRETTEFGSSAVAILLIDPDSKLPATIQYTVERITFTIRVAITRSSRPTVSLPDQQEWKQARRHEAKKKRRRRGKRPQRQESKSDNTNAADNAFWSLHGRMHPDRLSCLPAKSADRKLSAPGGPISDSVPSSGSNPSSGSISSSGPSPSSSIGDRNRDRDRDRDRDRNRDSDRDRDRDRDRERERQRQRHSQ
jgi:hypothetical protein